MESCFWGLLVFGILLHDSEKIEICETLKIDNTVKKRLLLFAYIFGFKKYAFV